MSFFSYFLHDTFFINSIFCALVNFFSSISLCRASVFVSNSSKYTNSTGKRALVYFAPFPAVMHL